MGGCVIKVGGPGINFLIISVWPILVFGGNNFETFHKQAGIIIVLRSTP